MENAYERKFQEKFLKEIEKMREHMYDSPNFSKIHSRTYYWAISSFKKANPPLPIKILPPGRETKHTQNDGYNIIHTYMSETGEQSRGQRSSFLLFFRENRAEP